MVGIFDSGLGGLTALMEFSKIMPYEDIVYFGDTGRVPYGSRSREIILKYSMQDMRFLLTHDVDAVLVACGTVSSVALDMLRENFPQTPMVGVIDGAAKKAVESTKNGVIGIIATSATVNSRSYEKAIKKLSPGIKIVAAECPLFVSLVENNFIDPDDEITRLTAERYLKSIDESGADTLILGCTHFPIITPILQKILPNVTMVNSSKEAAIELASIITPSSPAPNRKINYYISDTPNNFKAVANVFLGKDIEKNTTKIDIEGY